MTEIRDAGSIRYNSPQGKPPVRSTPEKEEALPKDKVTIGRRKSLGEKIIEFPGKVIKGVAGVAVGTVTAPLHALPGALKGFHLGASNMGSKGNWSFYFSMAAQNIAIGGSVGLSLGGIIGAALGAGAGLLATGIMGFVGNRLDIYHSMFKEIDGKVEKALKDNKGSKTEVAFQNATEGTIIGSAVAMKEGWEVGYETGKGIVSGVVDVAEGVVGGIVETGKNIIHKVQGSNK